MGTVVKAAANILMLKARNDISLQAFRCVWVDDSGFEPLTSTVSM